MSATATSQGPPAVSPIVAGWLERHAPEVSGPIGRLQEEAFAALDPVLLEICRLRIAALLGDTEEQARRAPAALNAGLTEAKVAALPSWPDSPLFDERERVCLAFTEMFVGDVSGITDDDAAAVLEALGPAQFHGFTTALLALDQHQRLRLAMLRVLGAPEDGP